jgi:hypothetical protein
LKTETENEEQAEQVKPYDTAKPFLSPQMVETILYLYEQKPPEAILTYDSRHGLGWQDTDWFVYFGDGQEISMKISVYQAILDYLIAANTYPVMMSVENVHTPFYRLEP